MDLLDNIITSLVSTDHEFFLKLRWIYTLPELTNLAKCSKDRSKVASAESGKAHPGNWRILKWYRMQSQQTPLREQGEYEQLQCLRFCSFLHSILSPLCGIVKKSPSILPEKPGTFGQMKTLSGSMIVGQPDDFLTANF